MTKIISSIICLCVIYFSLTIQTFASLEFGTQDNWTFFNNEGTVEFTDQNKIHLFTTNLTRTFPYGFLGLNGKIFNDYSIKFSLQYSKITPWGIGLRIGNAVLPNNQPINEFNTYINTENNLSKLIMFQAWQDETNTFRIRLCPEENNKTVCLLNPQSNSQIDPRNSVLNRVTSDEIKFTLEKKTANLKIFIQNITQNAPQDLLYETDNFHRVPEYILLGNNVKTDNELNFSNLTLHNGIINTTKQKPTESIILLPGMFGSWNREAMLHNAPVNPQDWQLNPIVKEYDGLINTFNNLGLVEGTDYYIFPYDWRKPITASALDLKNFINEKIPPEHKVNLIGHSLGGLVSRIFTQENDPENVNTIITLGSPHLGVPDTYKMVYGGEIEASNTISWLGQKILLQLFKKNFTTNKDALNSLLPVARDLLPIYNFLKKPQGEEINIADMSVKNDTLSYYLPTLPGVFDRLRTISGAKGDTLKGYVVAPRTLLDQLLGYYASGRPIDKFYSLGDETVTLDSGRAGADFVTLQGYDHGEIVYQPDAIAAVLNSLELPYSPEQIIPGEKTIIFPSLIFLIQSPATITVEHDGQIFNEQQGVVHIPNARSGMYLLKVRGTDLGRYTILIGQFSSDHKDLWTNITGKIVKNPPDTQTDEYQINFHSQSAQFPVSDPLLLFDELINSLAEINIETHNKFLSLARVNLIEAKKIYTSGKLTKLNSMTIRAHRNLFRAMDINNSDIVLEVVDKLENLYGLVAVNSSKTKPQKIINTLNKLEKSLKKTEVNLINKKTTHQINVDYQVKLISLAEEKMLDTKAALESGQHNLGLIIIESVKRLLHYAEK